MVRLLEKVEKRFFGTKFGWFILFILVNSAVYFYHFNTISSPITNELPERFSQQISNHQNVPKIIISPECPNKEYVIVMKTRAKEDEGTRNLHEQHLLNQPIEIQRRFEILFAIGHKLIFNGEIVKQPEKYLNKVEKFIVGNYIDSYENLTYKTLSILAWFNHNCKTNQTLITLDSDMTIDYKKVGDSITPAGVTCFDTMWSTPIVKVSHFS